MIPARPISQLSPAGVWTIPDMPASAGETIGRQSLEPVVLQPRQPEGAAEQYVVRSSIQGVEPVDPLAEIEADDRLPRIRDAQQRAIGVIDKQAAVVIDQAVLSLAGRLEPLPVPVPSVLPEQAVLDRAQPERASPVDRAGHDAKLARHRPGDAVHPAVAQPQDAILEDDPDAPVRPFANRLGLAGIAQHRLRPAAGADAVQAVLLADIDRAVAGGHERIAPGRGARQDGLGHHIGGAEALQAGLRSNPDIPLPVLDKRGRVVRQQPVAHADALDLPRRGRARCRPRSARRAHPEQAFASGIAPEIAVPVEDAEHRARKARCRIREARRRETAARTARDRPAALEIAQPDPAGGILAERAMPVERRVEPLEPPCAFSEEQDRLERRHP